ncbi:unnamed protein product [Hymenolepis diminuta]|uniref:Uncharacterized protein n=1 Tax=Hymenolepis diminuta TaxID=6216 RepID=A0A564XZH0_HYMDI|nr:unnamed protein product [Hymenolepis diminuta]
MRGQEMSEELWILSRSPNEVPKTHESYGTSGCVPFSSRSLHSDTCIPLYHVSFL